MEEKLLALLVAKFIGVPEATLRRIALKKASSVTDENLLQSIADGIDFGQIVQSDVDSKITDANKKAIDNFKKQNNIKVEEPARVPATVGDPNDIATIIANAIAPLTQKIESLEKQKTVESLSSTVKSKLKEKGIPESFVGRISVDDPEQIDEFVTSEEQRFLTFKQEQVNTGNWVDKPKSTPQAAAAVDDQIKSWAESRKPLNQEDKK